MVADALKYPPLNSSNTKILLSKTSMCMPGFAVQILYALSFLESLFLFILPCYRSSVQYSFFSWMIYATHISSRWIRTGFQLNTGLDASHQVLCNWTEKIDKLQKCERGSLEWSLTWNYKKVIEDVKKKSKEKIKEKGAYCYHQTSNHKAPTALILATAILSLPSTDLAFTIIAVGLKWP